MIRVFSAAPLMLIAATIVAPAETSTSKGFFDVISADDLKNFCIFRGDAYSIGAFMCDNTKQANICAGPEETPPSGMKPTGRAFWRSVDAEQVCSP
jgi:hypothetical protein